MNILCFLYPSHTANVQQSFEKSLVQNMFYGLSPSLEAALKSIPRWRLVQAALPHVMHCAGALLHNR